MQTRELSANWKLSEPPSGRQSSQVVKHPLCSFTSSHTLFCFLFCRSRMAFVSFRKVRVLIVFFPLLKLIIAHLATPDWRERRLVENCFPAARISPKYFASTT